MIAEGMGSIPGGETKIPLVADCYSPDLASI